MTVLMIAYSQLQKGNTVVLMGRVELEKVLGAVEKYRVTHVSVVPPVMILLVKHSALVRLVVVEADWFKCDAFGERCDGAVCKEYPSS
jgi:single-stranded DNA-binding protein